jgi:hypothetical protein
MKLVKDGVSIDDASDPVSKQGEEAHINRLVCVCLFVLDLIGPCPALLL